MHKTKNAVGGDAGFPDVITNLPEAEVTCQGSKAWILQAESMQLVFFEFQEGGNVTDHNHDYAQWGMVIDGAMELCVDGKTQMFRKGDEYLIPPRAIHSARFPCKTRLMDLFCEKERYKRACAQKQYQEIAMKNLRINTKIPDQNEDTILKLEQQNRELRDRLEKIEKTLCPNQQSIEYERYLTEHPEQAEWEEKQMEEHLKWGKEHPEEGKHQQEQADKDLKDHEKHLTEHPEQAEWEEKQMEEMTKIHQEERLTELEEKMNAILKLLRKDKETLK